MWRGERRRREDQADATPKGAGLRRAERSEPRNVAARRRGGEADAPKGSPQIAR